MKVKPSNGFRGTAPSGRIPVYRTGRRKGQPKIPGEASRFTSDAKHLEAYYKANTELQNRINKGTALDKESIEVDVVQCGEIYSIDPMNSANVNTEIANKALAHFEKIGTSGKYKLITLYPIK